MDYQYLTGSGLYVSKLCLGTLTFGGKCSETDSSRMLDIALDAGINFIDTANNYAEGRSEEILGHILKHHRNDLVLASKACQAMKPADSKLNQGLNRRHLYMTVDRSLSKLHTDWLDILYLHQPDYQTPLHETLFAVSDLIKSGKIRYFALSNYPAWMVSDILAICEKEHLPYPILGEYVINPLTRDAELELFPCFKAHRIGIAAYNPLAGGLLTGKYKTWANSPKEQGRFSERQEYVDRYWTIENYRAIQEMEEAAVSIGITITELALRWCTYHDGVDSLIIGASNEDQLKANITFAQQGVLPPEILEKLNAIWKRLPHDRFSYLR